MRLTEHRDLVFFHGLQDGRLGFGRGPVDLVGQHDVGENRTRFECKRPLAVALGQDLRAHNIRRHQVGGKLDPLGPQAHRPTQGFHQQGFAQTGRALQQNMPAGKKGGQHFAYNLTIADNDAPDLFLQRAEELTKALYAVFVWVSHCVLFFKNGPVLQRNGLAGRG